MKTKHDILSEIKQVMSTAEQSMSYLFLGKMYDGAYGEALAKSPNPYLIETYSVDDTGFSKGGFGEFVDSCTDQGDPGHRC